MDDNKPVMNRKLSNVRYVRQNCWGTMADATIVWELTAMFLNVTVSAVLKHKLKEFFCKIILVEVWEVSWKSGRERNY